MSRKPLLTELVRVEEPRAIEQVAEVLRRVASDRRPIVLRSNGQDLAAVISMDHLELLQEILARQELEKQAAQIDWQRLVPAHQPPPEWLEDTDNPCAPEELAS